MLCALAGLAFLVAAIGARSYMRDLDNVAQVTESYLTARLSALDKVMEEAMAPDTTGWMQLGRLRDDEVVYKYVFDTLQSWSNQFIVLNDNIQSPYFTYQRLSRPEYGLQSPLATIGDSWEFRNIGPDWYAVKSVSDGINRVIAGLQICSVGADGQISDINPALHLPEFYSIRQLTGYTGTEVSINGTPLFLIINSSPDTTHLFANSRLRWIGLGLIVLSLLLYLPRRRKLVPWLVVSANFLIFYFLARYWGGQMSDNVRIFSPSVYAGGSVWSSFGDLMLLNLLLIVEFLGFYLVREALNEWIASDSRKERLRRSVVSAGTLCLFIAGIVYAICSVCSLINNSGITFELKWFKEGLGYTVCALVVYSALFASLMLLLQEFATLVCGKGGQKIRVISPIGMSIAASAVTVLLFALSSGLGFTKEQQRVGVWANMLSVDRDLALELHLRSVEEAIATDDVVALLTAVDGSSAILTNRIKETYFMRFANEYDITVSSCAMNDLECQLLFNRKLSGGSPIADYTNFVCIYHNNGRSSYAGLFTYAHAGGEPTRMLVELFSKSAREDSGFYSIFKDLARPGNVSIPDEYSYGKYVDGKLVSYRGTYAYPTVLTDWYADHLNSGKQHFRTKTDLHFINIVGDDEEIVISRPRRTSLQVLSSFLTILTVVFLVMMPVSLTKRKKREVTNNTFRRRIYVVLMSAIFVSLASLATVSIKFVFDRNRADTNNMMSSKISTVQTMVESLAQDAPDYGALMSQEFRNSLLAVAANTKSDVSLYTPDGRVFVSTVADVFDMDLLSTRISNEAYDEVVNKHQRMYMAKESFDGTSYYALYAPVFNRRDEMVAILSTPYSSGSSLMQEAVPHAVLLLIIVLTLLAVFATISTTVVNAVFSPLTEVSEKMQGAADGKLETIAYDHDDEISALIASYNRMVHDLEESSRKMAQNERDMAWSEMARQVAHEIKNPLTPMKLAIQRLIRLKQRNDPAWTEKFDDLSNVVLEQIDILTETANDFSTFAKLYTEDPVEVDLDKMLQEQLMIFDNKENITLTYIGMPDALIMAPRPQLIRVVVNLITNAIQAIEINQQECAEEGKEVRHGMVNVLLRNSNQDGYYDVVVEDNGPGVAEENQAKLFTPKFTTKSAGAGLGLAISRSIIDKCGGEISYARSISLGGASFLIRLPKKS
ncbi:MAG: ATP-binding protein [Bacteroidales bacterium]|nr:ATP-binding protein [Bacteroidales bacterium]